MAVYRLKSRQQPRAAFAVQAADGTAQAVDGEGQLFAFGKACALLHFEFGQFLGGDQVDRANALAVVL